MRRHEREHRNGNGSPRTLLKGPLPTSPRDGTEGFGWTSAALCSQQVFLDETQNHRWFADTLRHSGRLTGPRSQIGRDDRVLRSPIGDHAVNRSVEFVAHTLGCELEAGVERQSTRPSPVRAPLAKAYALRRV